ncbi:MAG: glycosyltransferase family 1 protein [Catalinimonas sp.]
MKIILIGNYPKDRQESMERFAQMLLTGFRRAGVSVELWRPVVFFGARSATTVAGVGKWLGYLDKWVAFPLVLRLRHRRLKSRGENVRYHICDHSNAPYLNDLPKRAVAVTCHDVLAIQGAFGYPDTYCPAGPTGKILQRWILKHLSRARTLATVSRYTLEQLRELRREPTGADWRVIYNGFNANFAPVSAEEALPLLRRAGLPEGERYLLHVGSSLPRKNRVMLLEMLARAKGHWAGRVCFAGVPPDAKLLAAAESLGVANRVTYCKKPDHATLLALYSHCHAFIFPSFSEGFGWPLIEAQACGAPVIASNLAPLPEVTGGAALHADPKQPDAFVAALSQLDDEGTRAGLIEAGFENVRRFGTEEMTDAYLALHGEPSVPAS